MKPLSFKSSEMWHTNGLIILLYEDNPWLLPNDIVFSAYISEDGTELVASGESKPANVSGNPKQLSVITKAWSDNRSDYPQTKTGFAVNENITWILYREDRQFLLDIYQTYSRDGNICGKANLTDQETNIIDNLYYSLDPIWPTITSLKTIVKPVLNKSYTLPQFVAYSQLLPKYIDKLDANIYDPGIVFTKSVNSTGTLFLNSCRVKFISQSAINKGEIYFELKGNALPNSASEDTLRSYRLYW